MTFRPFLLSTILCGTLVAAGFAGASTPSTSPLAAPSTGPSTRPSTAASIVIDQEPPVVKRVMFDRFHRNIKMPATLPGEAALTQSDYECAASVTYRIEREDHVDGHLHVIARIAAVKLALKLTDTIFLPQLVPLELRAHEEGHRKMNEMVYADGNAVAHQVAQELLDQEWPGDGADEDAAGKAATDAAVQKLCNEYLRHTSQRSSMLGDIYDKLTSHGRNTLVVANAIKLSFEEEKKIDATQPATTQVTLRAEK